MGYYVADPPLLNERCTSLLRAPRLRNDLYCVEWDVKLYYTIPKDATLQSTIDIQELYCYELPPIFLSPRPIIFHTGAAVAVAAPHCGLAFRSVLVS